MSDPARRQPAAMVTAAALGLILDATTGLAPVAEASVLPLLLVLLAGVFAQLPHQRLLGGRRPARAVAASLAVNFLWTPALAGLLGAVVLGGEPALRVGLVLLLVTPCTDWYLVFTRLARGDMGMALALLPLNLAIQLLALPVYVLVLTGAVVEVGTGRLLRSVALVLVVPAILALAAHGVVRVLGGPRSPTSKVRSRQDAANLALLSLAVTAVYTAHGEALRDRPAAVALLLPALGAFYLVNLGFVTTTSRLLRLDRPQQVTLTMTTLARNSPLALAVGVAAFPDEPLVALALVLGPLLELPVLATAAARLRVRPRA